MISSLNFGWFLAYSTFEISIPLAYRNYLALFSILPLAGGSSFRQIKQVKYFLPSPIAMTLAKNGNINFISFSIKTGGMFYPPAVMISYLTRPVMNRIFLSLSLPISPECKYPSLSKVF